MQIWKLLNNRMETNEWSSKTVVGQAWNNSASSLSCAEIRVKFYDANGNLLGSSIDNINDFDVGETWSFEVMYFDADPERIDNYKIAIGTSY